MNRDFLIKASLPLMITVAVFFIVWMAKMFPAFSATTLSPDEIKRVENILKTRCSTCHDPPKPDEFSSKKQHIVDTKMGQRAYLNNADKELLLKYIDLKLKKK